MRWKTGTFEKIETNDSSIEKLIHTFAEHMKHLRNDQLSQNN